MRAGDGCVIEHDALGRTVGRTDPLAIDASVVARTTALHPGLATTPSLETLGEGGLVYRQALAPSSWTLPSMAALFSGREITARRTRAFPDSPSLAERFAEAGYRTVGLVARVPYS